MTEEQAKMVSDIHTALFSVPPGSPEGTRPLIEEINSLVTAYKRGSWAVRALVWLLPAIAGVGIAVQTIRSWFPGSPQ